MNQKYISPSDVISKVAERVVAKPPISIFKGEEIMVEHLRLNEKFGNGLVTGFEEVDSYFKFIPQQLYLISAQTHVGKTTFALNICSILASFNEPVLFCSLEQGVFIAPRVKSMVGKIPENLSILTSEKMLSVKDIVEYVYSMEVKPKLLCIDHLHFIKKSGNAVTADIDTMMAEIQNMAKELELPVIIISHLRKLNEDRIPTLDDLRDSSSLSQIPSVVMFLHRSKNEGEELKKSILSNHGVLIIAKNRIQGKTGIIRFSLKDSGLFDFSCYKAYDQAEKIFK